MAFFHHLLILYPWEIFAGLCFSNLLHAIYVVFTYSFGVPENKLPFFEYHPGPLFFATSLLSITVVVWRLVERHSSYAWIIFLGLLLLHTY